MGDAAEAADQGEGRSARVHLYGCLRPTQNEELVRAQLRAAHQYQNQLIELERCRRATYRKLRTDLCDLGPFEEVEARLAGELGELRAAINAERQRTRSRVGVTALSDRAKAVHQDLKVARAGLKEARQRARDNPAFRKAAFDLEQRHKVWYRGLRAMTSCFWGCVDDETEILTAEGWKRRWEFHGSERVATYNLATDRLEWQEATGKTEASYTGKMARVKNARLDMLLTPNHRMVVQRLSEDRQRSRTCVVTAEEMPRSNRSLIRIPQAAPGLGPAGAPLDVSPALAAVIGWVLSDGSLVNSRNTAIIDQSRSANPYYCEVIREDLAEAGITYTERESKYSSGVMIRFRISGADSQKITRWIPEKRLTPALVFGLSDEAAQRLFESLLFGDGTRDQTSTGKPRWRWIQKYPGDVALFQALALRLGHASHATKRAPSQLLSAQDSDSCYTASVRLQPYSTWQSSKHDQVVTWVDFEGMVWCPSTPNTTWVARRNGTLFITGNSYLLVERSVDQARRSKVDPAFKRWRGEGRIGVQLQGGLTVEALHKGRDTRARLLPAPAEWLGRTTSARGRRHKVQHLLQLRIGSTGPQNRVPVFAVFPIIMHRPLPEGALVSGIVVRLRKIGLSERWTAAFTYTRERARSPTPERSGVVAVDLGWRKRPDASLRAAYWVDDRGRSGEIRMPARVGARLRYADRLREIQDHRFNKTTSGLARWLRAAERRLALPLFVRDVAPYVAQWRAHGKLHALVDRWKGARFDGDKQIFAALWRWRLKSRHLYAWECHQRTRALGYRREVYRVAAARFARHYGVVVLDDLDLNKAKRRSAPEHGPDAPPPVRAQMHACAPGELRLAIMQAVDREGGVAVKLSAAGTTTTCHACGKACVWDQKEDIWHTCEHCGSMWDQDLNAAKNLLARWQGAPIAPKKLVRVPKIRKRPREPDAIGS